jgi:hypothetical protein
MPTAPRTHRLSRTVAASLAVAALAAPAAAARPAYDTPSPPDSGPAVTSVDTAATSAPAPSPPVVRSIDEGFDWGAAGIAAGATAGVVLLGLGGVSSRRRSHPRRAVAG